MIQRIYSIFDGAAHAYLPPFFLPNDAMATRSFADCACDPNHAFYRNAADYTLFAIGEFEDETAVLTGYEIKRSLGLALEFKPTPPPTDAEYREAMKSITKERAAK